MSERSTDVIASRAMAGSSTISPRPTAAPSRPDDSYRTERRTAARMLWPPPARLCSLGTAYRLIELHRTEPIAAISTAAAIGDAQDGIRRSDRAGCRPWPEPGRRRPGAISVVTSPYRRRSRRTATVSTAAADPGQEHRDPTDVARGAVTAHDRRWHRWVQPVPAAGSRRPPAVWMVPGIEDTSWSRSQGGQDATSGPLSGRRRWSSAVGGVDLSGLRG